MAKELRRKTKIRIEMILCIVAFLALQVLVMVAGRIGVSTYNGLFMACQFALCLIMVRMDHTKGIIYSLILMAFSAAGLVQAIAVQHVASAWPGMGNSIIYMITLTLLARQFRIREKEAVTDLLTGLLNRRGLYRLLQNKIEDDENFNVAYVDLGNFKFINDNYGHAYGDYLLKTVADRMAKVVGKSGVITRIGGDEFVIVLDSKLDPEQTTLKIIEKISEKATVTLDGNKVECYLTAYAGIANYPEDSRDFESLIKYSDIAMYQASRDKSHKICFFNKDMEKVLQRQVELEKLIKEGLENDYFYLAYQPQHVMANKKLRGFESLLRMKTPDGTIVSPGEFIPVAEKGDLIIRIDDYVINRAMKEFKKVVEKTNPDLIISINVSAKNIGSLGFTEKIEKALKKTGFPAKNLEIEITEYCLVQSVDVTIENIKKLRDMGIQVALDDFGTGYTSLSYLAKMPINLLKVDKSLVDDIESSQKSLEFVHAVISMGHMMGCEVISEGVESENQLSLLREHGCDLVQGFVWGRPMDYDKALELCGQEQ